MSVTRVGATKQYSDGWENIFGGEKRSSSARPKKAARPVAKSSAKRKPAKKKARSQPAKKSQRNK
jgi:hypothetical protein